MAATRNWPVLVSRLRAAAARFGETGEVRLVWELENVSPEPIFLFRDRFDPAVYVEVPEHPLVGATLLVTHEGRPAECVVSEGGPIGIVCTPRRAHYEYLQPRGTYRFVFDGLQYTSFSPAEPFRHRTRYWVHVSGELVAEVDYDAEVRDPELQLEVWTGRIRSNQIVFRVG